MPHLTLEISETLPLSEPKALLLACNQALFATGVFKDLKDIKSRLYITPHSLIGAGADGEHFVVAKLQLLAGRDDSTKTALVQTLLDTLRQHISPSVQGVQYAVDISDLSPFYQKAFI